VLAKVPLTELKYPIEASPVTVERRVGVERKPDVKYPLVIPPVVDKRLAWRPDVVERRVGVERKSDVKYPLVIPPVVERRLV
jgi:hypothetical protein